MTYTKLIAVQILKEGETYISGEEWLKRAKAITKGTMDKKAFEFYKKEENWHLLPDCDYLYFPDTDYIDPRGGRFVLCFYRRGGEWCWRCVWLGGGWGARHRSASFVSAQDSDSQPSSDSLTLELRVEALESDMVKIRKFLII